MNYLLHVVDFRMRSCLACSCLKFINGRLSSSWKTDAFDVVKNTQINISNGFASGTDARYYRK